MTGHPNRKAPMVRRLAGLTLATFVLAAPTAAQAHPWLSKAHAETAIEQTALGSAHRTWRLSDITTEDKYCKREASWEFVCEVTVGLHYNTDPEVEAVTATAVFLVGEGSQSEWLWRVVQPWEVNPTEGGER
jgi:hypothetical protein